MSGAISLERISKQLGGRGILNSVSFTVERGDIFGYLGPNGAGKTTTIRVILGLFKADSGEAYVLGNRIQSGKFRRNIGFVLEADGLYDNLSARENLGFYSQIYGMPEANRGERVEEMIRLAGLQPRANDRVSTYSKGMRQKLALARAMIHDPDLLVLDEPTAGVDPSGQIEVRNAILSMALEKGKTVFLSSHNLDEVQRICNRIALIDRGRIRLCGELENLKQGMGQQELTIVTAAETMDNAEVLDELVVELQALPYVASCNRQTNTLRLSLDGTADVAEMVAMFSKRDVEVFEVRRSGTTLEEIYARVVGESSE